MRWWWALGVWACADSQPAPAPADDSDVEAVDTARPEREVQSFSVFVQLPWDAATNTPAAYPLDAVVVPPNIFFSLHDRVTQVTGQQPYCTVQVVWDDPTTVSVLPPEDGRLVGVRFPGPAATRQSACREEQTEDSFSEAAIADALDRIRASVDVVLSLGGPVDPEIEAVLGGVVGLGASFAALQTGAAPGDGWIPAAYGLGYAVDGEGRIVLDDGDLVPLSPDAFTVEVEGQVRPATALWRVETFGAFSLAP